MENKELQVENGNFTRIVNPLIENLIKVPFKGCELSVALFIIRKTYGFQKKEDEISLTQICDGVNRSRPTVVKALENLKLVNIAKLVSVGDSKKRSNIWSINKYFNEWKLVNIAKLVKTSRGTSKDGFTLTSKDGLTHKRKKEITKEISKTSVLQGKQWNELIDLFKEINPMYTDFYSNRTERKALEDMASKWGYDKLLSTIKELPKIIGQPFAPKITRPTELRRDIGKLVAFYNQEKNKITNKKSRII